MQSVQSRLPHGNGVAGPQEPCGEKQCVPDNLLGAKCSACSPDNSQGSGKDQHESDPLGAKEGFMDQKRLREPLPAMA
jgi:hypothetical protein